MKIQTIRDEIASTLHLKAESTHINPYLPVLTHIDPNLPEPTLINPNLHYSLNIFPIVDYAHVRVSLCSIVRVEDNW